MNATEYRRIIAGLIRRELIRQRIKGVGKQLAASIGAECAKQIHARMYGANVEGVDSPIFRDDLEYHSKLTGEEYTKMPTVSAQELLNRNTDSG